MWPESSPAKALNLVKKICNNRDIEFFYEGLLFGAPCITRRTLFLRADLAASDSDGDTSLSSASAYDNASDDVVADVDEASAVDNRAHGMRGLPNDAFLDTDAVMSLITDPPSGKTG